jgi:hypothetical protein
MRRVREELQLGNGGECWVLTGALLMSMVSSPVLYLYCAVSRSPYTVFSRWTWLVTDGSSSMTGLAACFGLWLFSDYCNTRCPFLFSCAITLLYYNINQSLVRVDLRDIIVNSPHESCDWIRPHAWRFSPPADESCRSFFFFFTPSR